MGRSPVKGLEAKAGSGTSKIRELGTVETEWKSDSVATVLEENECIM